MVAKDRGCQALGEPSAPGDFPGDGDASAVAILLGRPPMASYVVVVRDSLGGPVVIENSPLLDDGIPMPTRWWLVDRELRREVSRLETKGGVRQAERSVDPGALIEAHERYALLRDAALPAGYAGPRASGGVGGTRRGVKCLHAHLAWYLAGHSDPVGAWVAGRLAATIADRGLDATIPSDCRRIPDGYEALTPGLVDGSRASESGL